MSEKIKCKKDWYLDGQLGFKEGKSYVILKKEKHPYANCILLKSIFGFKGWVWSNSEYFDVDSVFL